MDGDIIEVIKATGSVANLFSKLLDPWCIRKKAEAEKYAEELRLSLDRKRTKNIESVFEKARLYIDERIENAVLDEDWIFRFIEIAQNTNDEKMQDFLAKTLASKLKDPNCCSTRTLSVLCDLSHDECLLFAKLLKYSVHQKDGTVYLLHPKIINGYQPGSTNYSEHMLLSECNLSTMLDGCYSVEPDHDVSLIYGNHVGVIKANGDTVDIRCLSCLTKAGEEIYQLLREQIDIESDLDLFRHALRIIGSYNGMSVSLHRLGSYDMDNIYFYPDDELRWCPQVPHE